MPKRMYIADCHGYTTGQYEAANDRAAMEHAVDHFAADFKRGMVEVWDVRSDIAVYVVDIMDYVKEGRA